MLSIEVDELRKELYNILAKEHITEYNATINGIISYIHHNNVSTGKFTEHLVDLLRHIKVIMKFRWSENIKRQYITLLQNNVRSYYLNNIKWCTLFEYLQDISPFVYMDIKNIPYDAANEYKVRRVYG